MTVTASLDDVIKRIEKLRDQKNMPNYLTKNLAGGDEWFGATEAWQAAISTIINDLKEMEKEIFLEPTFRDVRYT